MPKPSGGHPHNRLTAVRVRALKTGRFADGNGLYLFVEPSGAKRWILRTVVKGRRRDIGLGSAHLVPLADARIEAARLRRLARTGGDPLAERRRERRTTVTFKEAAITVHASHASTFRNPKHRLQWLSSLESNVFPMLGGRSVDGIESGDVLKVLGPIWSTKPETARRVKQRIRVVMDWAKASGHRVGDNPVDGVTKVLPKQRRGAHHHAALPYAMVPSFLQELQATDSGESTRLAFEFLILTAARTGEVLAARWEEMDLKSKTWAVPAIRMKAGREHRVPLSSRCSALLEQAKAISDGGPYVFPGRVPNTTLSNMLFLMLLRRMNRADITAHGFRSSFRDWAAEKSGSRHEVIEAALAHVVKNKAEAAYFRSDLFELRRALMEHWARFASAGSVDAATLQLEAPEPAAR